MSAVEILLVEDSPEDRELTLRALRTRNLVNRLHCVADGEEALEFLFATGRYRDRAGEPAPRLVCLDLKLPRVDGLEVLRRLRAEARTRTVPVVVLTSSREERDLVESYRLGVNSYVVKPVEFEPFVQAVSELGLYWLLLNQPPAGSA
jgi:two-component system, response regulator